MVWLVFVLMVFVGGLVGCLYRQCPLPSSEVGVGVVGVVGWGEAAVLTRMRSSGVRVPHKLLSNRDFQQGVHADITGYLLPQSGLLHQVWRTKQQSDVVSLYNEYQLLYPS